MPKPCIKFCEKTSQNRWSQRIFEFYSGIYLEVVSCGRLNEIGLEE